MDRLFEFLAPILKDQDDTNALSDENKYEFEREQTLAARLFHLIYNDDTGMHCITRFRFDDC